MKRILLLILLFSATANAQVYTMQNGTFSTCSGTFYDSGGAVGNYGPNESYQITFCPSTPGSYVQLNFSLLDIEGAPFEMLTIRNGVGTGGSVIPLPTAVCSPIVSSSPSGCLTITFVSDGSFQYEGWEAAISCSATPGVPSDSGPPNAICSGANPFCADAGPLEFPNISSSDCVANAPNVVVANTCLGTAPNPAWYFLEIGTAGNLTLNISQSTGPGGTGTGLDVDFVIWGPFSNAAALCGSFTAGGCLGDHDCSGIVVDCSYDPAAVETAIIPNALVGQVYLVLITNFEQLPGYITMTQTNTGSPGAGGTDCSIVCPTTVGTNPTCGASDGYITISGLDPSTLYNISYLDDGVATSISLPSSALGVAIIPNLNAGNYTNIVTNFSGCTGAFTSVSLTSAAGPVLSSITSNSPICAGANAIFTITGTANTTVTYNVNAGASQTVVLNSSGTANVTVSSVTGNTTLNATLITNTITGCSTPSTLSRVVVVNLLPTASIGYSASSYCTTASPQLVTLAGTGGYTGGTYTSSPAGLTINAATGQITPSSSAGGSYTVTYTTPASGGCASVQTTTGITISVPPTANISFSAPAYCTTSGIQNAVLTGTGVYTGGIYSVSPSGLIINAATGQITPSASSGGSYTVTYTITAGGCTTIPATASVTVTAAPTASIAYGQAAYCTTAGPAGVTITGTGAYTGGAYTASPSGLSIDSTTGEITPFASTAGNYTVTYTIPAGGGCAATAVNAMVAITLTPTASIAYGQAVYCTTAGPAGVTITGTGAYTGGAFTASPSGLAIDSITGEITPSASSGGSYTVTYTITAGGCTTIPATASVTVTAAPTASTAYGSAAYCTTAGPAGVTVTGTGAYTGGAYTASPSGLSIDSTTGEITPFASTAGNYTVTYTIPAGGGCAATAVNAMVAITLTPTASIAYGQAVYCTTAGPAGVTITGTGAYTGGAFTASPSGLAIDSITGEITPSASSGGSYTVTYTITAGGCTTIPATASVTVTAAPTASIAYGSAAYCTTAGPAGVTITGTGAYTGGAFTASPAGLSIDSTTGEITPFASTAGNYTVTYTIPAGGGCAATAVNATVAITLTPTASIAYGQAAYCTTAGPAGVTITGTGAYTGGAFTASPAGLAIDSITGEITPSASSGGSYTVTYTITAGGCTTIPATASVTVTAAPTASIAYALAAYCTTAGPAGVTITGTGAYTGGTYTASPLGLSIDSITGEITPFASTAGNYTVTYTIPAGGGCAATAVNAMVAITLTPTASIAYGQAAYCTTAGPAGVTISGTGGAFTAFPSGLSIDSITGEITPSASSGGSYTVTYTITAGGCTTIPATATVTVTAAPTASIAYGQAAYCTTAVPAGVTISGTGAYTGGAFTASPAGLSIGSITGEITPSASTAGNYTVTYTIPAGGGCAATAVNAMVAITLTPTASIAYGQAAYCTTAGPAGVTITGTGAYTGGAFTAFPSGLSIDSITGEITPSASSGGSYTVTYTITAGGCTTIPATASVTVTAAPTALIAYGSAAYCTTAGPAGVTITGTGAYTGGAFTASPLGLSIDSTTGEITPSASTAGNYTVTYTIPAGGSCAATAVNATVAITLTPTASIAYGQAVYCTTAGPAGVTITGTGAYTGGAFTASPSGLAIDSITGEITPSASSGGSYTVTYTITAGGCTTIPATASVTVTAAPTASTAYGSAAYCTTAGPAGVTVTGTGAYTGGAYTASPSGLSIDSTTGEITPFASTAGNYTVTYTIPAGGGCAATAVNAMVAITLTPTASIAYGQAVYCTTAGPAGVTITGTGAYTGGAFTASPSGLAIDSITGEITPSASSGGSYTVTYTITAGGCTTIPATASVTVTAAPTASIAYGSAAYCTTAGPAGVTITGTGAYTGGAFTASPAGLSIDSTTGEITPFASTAGNYTVTYTILAGGGCATAAIITEVQIISAPTVNINYAAGSFCQADAPQPVTLTGTGAFTGGTYSVLPTGLSINPTSGEIAPATSLPGNYTITYNVTFGGCAPISGSTVVAIQPNATIALTSALATSDQTTCIGTPIASITYHTDNGATGVNAVGLPTGITGSYSSGIFTISGTATNVGIFPFNISTIGGCSSASVSGVITVSTNTAIELTSAIGTDDQLICINTPLTPITYQISLGGTGATVTGLPNDVNAVFSGGVLTISGAPSQNGIFYYTITTTGGCGTALVNGTISVNSNVVFGLLNPLTSVNQTVCIATPIVNVRFAGANGVTGVIMSGLPTGVTFNYAAPILTISGTPSVAGVFHYTFVSTGGCGIATGSGFITVNPDTTISLASAAATTNQTVCANTAVLPIVYAIDNGGTGATVTGLPPGIVGNYLNGEFTINGAPTAPGVFNYVVTTIGGCSSASLAGTITITPLTSISLVSAASTIAQTICIDTSILPIQYTIGNGGTGATVSGLPPGISAIYNAGSMQITGIATTSGAYNYTVETSGGCGIANMSGTILVNPNVTMTLTSAVTTTNQIRCIGTSLSAIKYAIANGGTGATVTGLPSGITAVFSLGVLTIAGNPTISGTFDYSITTTGGCLSATATGTITVNPNASISLTSSLSSTSQVVCINSPIAPIVYTITNGGTGAIASGLPVGLTGNYSSGTFTISGTPSVSGDFSYSVTTTGGCASATLLGTVTSNLPATAVLNYAGSPYCDALTAPQSVGLSGTGLYVGGSYGSSPSGLSLNATTGAVRPSASVAGTYTVTYNIPASGGCPGSIVSTVVTITALPNAVINYPGSPYCKSIPGAYTVSLSGTAAFSGGTFSVLPAGLTLNPNTGAINPGTSVAGNYVVTYTTPAGGGCGPVSVTAAVTIYPVPTVTATTADVMICTGEDVGISLNSLIPGTTYSWTAQQTNVSGATGGSGNVISQTLNTTENIQGSVTYSVTPFANGCVGNPIAIVIKVNPLPVPILSDGTICVNPTTGEVARTYTFNAGLNNSAYDFEWYFNSTLIPGENNNAYTASAAGSYTVLATNISTGCQSEPVGANVTESFVAESLVVNGNTAFVDNPTITITVLGGADYEYQLDDSAFQTSNAFTNLSIGPHTISVRDSDGCTDITQEFEVIGYPHFFTPNGDGYNDTWNIEGLSGQSGAHIYIFDRYGKFIKQISPAGQGWDGTLNGRALPSTDYWFKVEYTEFMTPKEFRSHFSLKR